MTPKRLAPIPPEILERAWAAGMEGCQYVDEWSYENLRRAIDVARAWELEQQEKP